MWWLVRVSDSIRNRNFLEKINQDKSKQQRDNGKDIFICNITYF